MLPLSVPQGPNLEKPVTKKRSGKHQLRTSKPLLSVCIPKSSNASCSHIEIIKRIHFFTQSFVMLPALSFVLLNPRCVFQPLWHLQLTGAWGKGSLLLLSLGRFWQFSWAALKHKLTLPYLFFSGKKKEKGCLKYSLGYGTDIAQGTHAQIPGLNEKEQNLLLVSSRSLSKCSTSRPWSWCAAAVLACVHHRVFIYTKWFGPNRRLTVPPKCHVSNHVHTKITFETWFSYRMNSGAELADLFQMAAIALRGVSLRLLLGASTGQPAMLALLRAACIS